MTKTVEAVYENGTLRLLQSLDLAEGQRVKVRVITVSDTAAGPELTAEGEELMRRLGYKAFEDVPDEEWEKIAEAWKRD